jgi:hypothetical protein
MLDNKILGGRGEGWHTKPAAWHIIFSHGSYPGPEQCLLAWAFRDEFVLVVLLLPSFVLGPSARLPSELICELWSLQAGGRTPWTSYQPYLPT